jgi:cytochrome P450
MTNTSPLKVLSGPSGHWLFGSLRERNADAIRFFSKCFADHGDFFRVRFLHVPVFVIARPDLVKEVLFDRPSEFIRKRVFDDLSKLLGRGLLTTEGDKWRKHRRLAQPAFHMRSINGFFNVMVQATESMLGDWEQGLNQEATLRDISDDFMKLTLQIVSESLFGFNTQKDSRKIGDAVSYILPQIFYHLEGVPLLKNFPNKRNREFSRRLKELNEIIFGIIEERRKSKSENFDLLGMLMSAVDEEDSEGKGLSNKDLRDEVMTMFMAGHETTANALAWTLHALAENPDVEIKLREEVGRVVGQGPLMLEHLRGLTYAKQIFEESLRLYPPIWAMPRTSAKDTSLGGVAIPKDAVVSVNPFLLHRNPSVFKDPLKFDPDRFSPLRRKEIGRYDYIPFGAGPHTCIGSQFALMEAQVILASIYRRYRIEVPADEPSVRPLATITLRPEPAIRRRIQRLN